MNKAAEHLANLIEQNPDCNFAIDNDYWDMVKGGEKGSDDFLITSEEMPYKTYWYGHSSNYGFAVAEALIILLNRRGFNIKVEAV